MNTSTYPDPLPVGTIDLTQTGSAMTTIPDRGGIATQAISTNGDYFSAGGSPVNTTQQLEEMTASFWIKTNTSDANNRNLLRQYDGTEGFLCYINNGVIHLDGRFRFYRVSPAGWWNSGYHQLTANNGSIADDQWHHVVIQTQATSSTSGQGFTYSRINLNIWVDNVSAGSFAGIDYTHSAGAQRSNPGATTELFVGTSGTNPQPTEVYNDEIDDIRVYRRLLNGTEIGQLYNEQVNPCTSPTAVTVSNPTATTVDIDWTNGGSEGSWEVEAVVSGGAQGSGTVQTAGSHPYTFTGLDSNTDYDFYVRADCGGGSTSGWTSPETETTLCGVQTCENENFAGGMPPCWTTVASNGGAVSVVNINNNLKLRFGPNYNSIFTAALPEMASVNGYLSFNASNSTTTATPYYFVVGTMTDPTNQATFTAYETISFSGNNGNTAVEVDLTGYSGSDKFVAIRYTYGTNINVQVFVDDVQFTDGSCYWNTVFVDKNATGNNDGTSWDDAYTDLQDALFNYNGDPIWVAEGTYSPGLTRDATFSIPSGAKVYGGFDKTESWLSQRDLDNNITTLSGDIFEDDNGTLLDTESTRQDNSYHIVTLKGNVQGAVINGFTISGANANGGLDNSCATPAANQYIHSRGGAIYANPYASGHALNTAVSQCVFENNTSSQYAVYGAFGPCGVTGYSYDVDFDRCVFRNNYSGSGSALLFYSSGGYNIVGHGTVSNSLFHDNTSSTGASCLTYSASTSNGGQPTALSAHALNCTFSNNSGTGGRVIGSFNASNVRLRNSIVWGNGSTNPLVTTGGSGLIAQNSIVEGGYGGTATNSDPMFTDAGNDDYTLMAGSPAYNAGHNSYIGGPLDLIGTDRILDGTADMGAYEFFIPPCVASAPTITGFTNLSHHGTTISWNPTDVPVGGKFVVRYHEFGNSPNFSYKVVGENQTSAYINGLDASQRYVFRVGGKCATGNAVYSDTMSVTTKAHCPTPGGLGSNRTTAITATISWTDIGADLYKIKFRETGTSTWTYRNVPGPATSTDLTGLSVNNYEWKIRSICNAGGNRPYSPTQTLLALPARLAASNIEGFNTFPNPTNGMVNVEFNTIIGGEAGIAVRDLSGRILIQDQIELSAGNVRTSLDLSELTNGTYIVELTENTGLSHTTRVIKR